MTQTYCTKPDIEALWTPALLLASVDDDTSGTLSPTEEAYITAAIERAAGRMNAYLEQRYPLADLAGNAWCRHANAAIAAYLLSIRRGTSAPAPFQLQYDALLSDLYDISRGRLNVPEAPQTLEMIPTVSNFRIDPRHSRAKVRRVAEISSGSPPPGSRKSFPDE
ncbi:MAG TPA: phage protein Gp36 family protein [Pirellulaceae bacterium]|nr:phage protein Gp36 family protein [Pirellulaceae bacterium]